ncbi:hypothetical protein QVD17_29502 [Tagetes erecta]|uniref:Uncharacterized protein n=1 Tax=Tagetes erecta TaxID=13708 RepID=A0AAD8KBT6_TARER|nr:hypothetical protein QVD17_29502 [Tagetes erecta]
MDLSSSSDHDTQATDDDVNQSIDLINLNFNQQLDLQAPVNDEDHKNCSNEEDEHDEDEHHDDDNDDDDDDFTFMLIGNGDGTNYDDEVFEDGKIRPVFPLFDQKLLLTGEYEIEELDRLPILPPVDKIFVESPRGFPASTSSEVHNENEDEVAGPYCDWSKDSATATEMSKKSNSTGFSKLWRLKEKVGRSNSDGRDAFVFLKSAEKLSRTTTPTTATTTTTTGTGEGTYLKVKVGEGTARVVKKGKKKAVSAHEVYLRSRGGMAEEERRRSYLPYRPELMGLFTNVNGGLSKNVHPY